MPDRPKATLRVYAYSIDDDKKHAGLLKVGQTTGAVKKRVGEQTGTAHVDAKIHIDELAERPDGTFFSDFEVRARLAKKGFVQKFGEWMECTVADVRTVITELQTGKELSAARFQKFPMRPEQESAVARTEAYFRSVWAEMPETPPRFLWNAKMRFGKTFAAYHLAKSLGFKRILVLTFKPAVEDAWEADLNSHVDFEGWRFMSRETGGSPVKVARSKPLVYFGSFQDLMGKDKAGNIKAKNEWIHLINWDLVVFDEYHFGAWREGAKELFEGEDPDVAKKEIANEFAPELATFDEEMKELGDGEVEFLPITSRAYLYLSGTPFRALATGEFIEEQIFNWTYTDEQRAKGEFAKANPGKWNPYGALPEMRLFTYRMPDELINVARQGEFDEFDLNVFFEAHGSGGQAVFKHEAEVQKWLDILRGAYLPTQIDSWKTGTPPPLPYEDTRLLQFTQHSMWLMPSVAACHAMANLMAQKQNVYWHAYKRLVVAGPGAGIGLAALPPVRAAIGDGQESRTITLTCGKLTTGVTVAQWSAILMLRNLQSPEGYFQAAFRVQSPWSIKNPTGENPNEEMVLKPVCYVFDFALTRSLRQLSEYGIGLSPEEHNPEHAVQQLVKFLPVIAYNGSNMVEIDAAAILDIALSGTSATLLARKWESAILVNVDNDTLEKISKSEAAMKAIMNIEGFRALGSNIFETVVTQSKHVKKTKKEKGEEMTPKEKAEISDEEKEYRNKRKLIQQKLIKFATRIPAFMYLTDYRENTLPDVITKLEPELFKSVTGLEVKDFYLLVSIGVFNAVQMDQAIFAFRRYEDASLRYTGIDSHPNLRRYGLYDTVVAKDPATPLDVDRQHQTSTYRERSFDGMAIAAEAAAPYGDNSQSTD